MERYGISGDRAFALLVRVSRTANRKLCDVCEELVVTRELAAPARPVAPGEPTEPCESAQPAVSAEPTVAGPAPEQPRASQPAS